ncbi:LysR family transcriptional regulator [Amycolatopsis sp. NPDC059021]|uniref:LysR family transcriptional regulator n=1 Tax=Amycolatopsis sp. NPDC059021 TaxID=3346704 RepID=UPI00366CD3CC
MELRHLRYFVAIAEHRHFGRAARSLGIQQPPLSQQLKSLETEVGARLFDRTSRSVELTLAGRAFLVSAKECIRHADRAAASAASAARGETGRLVIGFIGSAMYSVLPPILRAYRVSRPGIALEPLELSSSEQATQLEADRIDIGFVRPPLRAAHDRRLETFEVVREPFVALLPRSHPLAGGPAVRMAMLAEEPIVLACRHTEPSLYTQVMDLCMRSGFEPVIATETACLHSVIGLVAAGVGIAITPRSLARVHNEDIVFRRLEPVPLAPSLTAVWHADNPNPALETFVNVVRGIAGYARPRERSAPG